MADGVRPFVEFVVTRRHCTDIGLAVIMRPAALVGFPGRTQYGVVASI